MMRRNLLVYLSFHLYNTLVTQGRECLFSEMGTGRRESCFAKVMELHHDARTTHAQLCAARR